MFISHAELAMLLVGVGSLCLSLGFCLGRIQGDVDRELAVSLEKARHGRLEKANAKLRARIAHIALCRTIGVPRSEPKGNCPKCGTLIYLGHPHMCGEPQ